MHRPKGETLLLLIAGFLLAALVLDHALASGEREQDHDCQGSNNCNVGGSAESDAIASSFANVGDLSVSTTTAVTVEGDSRPATVKIKNTPTTIAPDIYPTVPCFKGAAAGGSVPGFGISIGGGRVDKDCVKREYIRLAYAMGLINRATFLWCKQPAVWEDFGTIQDCLLFEVQGEDLSAQGFSRDTGMTEDEGVYFEDDMLAQVSEEAFEEREEKVDAEIEELRKRAEAAESRARQLESKVGGYEKGEESKQSQLEKLRELLEQDYERLDQQSEK